MIYVELPTKINTQKIYEAIPHKTRNKYSDWSKNVPMPFLFFRKKVVLSFMIENFAENK